MIFDLCANTHSFIRYTLIFPIHLNEQIWERTGIVGRHWRADLLTAKEREKVHVDEPEREKEKKRGEDGGEGKGEVGERKSLEGRKERGGIEGGKEKRGIGRRGEREGRIMKKVSTKLASL